MGMKWVKKDSQFATNAKGAPTSSARVSKAIVQKRNDAKAETEFKAKVIPPKAKDKGTNKRR
jgi:hypothetical protein